MLKIMMEYTLKYLLKENLSNLLKDNQYLFKKKCFIMRIKKWYFYHLKNQD